MSKTFYQSRVDVAAALRLAARFDMHEGITPDPDLFMLVRQSFKHRRKTLMGNLIKAGYARTTLTKALQGSKTNKLSRAEELDLLK